MKRTQATVRHKRLAMARMNFQTSLCGYQRLHEAPNNDSRRRIPTIRLLPAGASTDSTLLNDVEQETRCTRKNGIFSILLYTWQTSTAEYNS